MSTGLRKAKNQLVRLSKTGFFHIFGAGVINKILAVLLSFVLVRILSKEDYGVYAYAFNIVSFFVLFNGLGAAPAVLQMCSELHKERRKADAVYGYGYRAGFGIDLALMLIILLTGFFAPLSIEGSGLLLRLYCIYPLVTFLFDIKATRLRVLLLNREFARATNLQTVLLVCLSAGGAFFFKSIGLIVGQMLAYFLAYVFMCISYPFCGKESKSLTIREKRDFWKISSISSLNNGLSQSLTLVGTFLVGSLLHDDLLVANYQVATQIPYGLLFIPVALMTYAYPYFARNRNNFKWTFRNYIKLTAVNAFIMGAMTIALILIAEPLIAFLFGDQYADSVRVFQVLMVGFFIQSSFRVIPGNLLVTQRKLLCNTIVAVVSIVVIAASSLIAIPSLGVIGAALSYDITMLISAILYSVFYLRSIQRGKKAE